MLYLKTPDLIRSKMKLFRILVKFNEPEFERKLRCNAPERSHNIKKAFRADHDHRLRTVGVGHIQQHPRQSGDMIRMIMGKAHDIDRFGRPADLLERDLRTLAAVDQHVRPLAPQHK